MCYDYALGFKLCFSTFYFQAEGKNENSNWNSFLLFAFFLFLQLSSIKGERWALSRCIYRFLSFFLLHEYFIKKEQKRSELKVKKRRHKVLPYPFYASIINFSHMSIAWRSCKFLITTWRRCPSGIPKKYTYSYWSQWWRS